MKRVAVWPYATPMDLSGKMADELQGVYSRGLCGAIALGLIRTKLCEVAVCFPITTIRGITSWAVLGREWSQDEILAIKLPEGVDFVSLGSVVIKDSIDLHIRVVQYAQKRLLVDQTFAYSREEIPNCFSEVIAHIASAVAGRELTTEERGLINQWGTNDPDAYLAYLEAWSACSAFRAGVSVPNRNGALDCARKASKLDAGFEDAHKLQRMLSRPDASNGADMLDDVAGYTEFVYPIRSEGL